MKTVLRIFGVIFILIAILTCSLSIWRANTDREELITDLADAKAELAKYQAQISQMTGETRDMLNQQMAEAESKLNEGPSPSTYLIVEIFLTALLVLALAFGVFLFRPNLGIVTKLVAVAAVLLLVCYFISPDIKRGTYGGMESRTLALISGIPVVIVGLMTLLVAKKSRSQIVALS